MDWNDRVHFYAVSARVMRRILIDDARDQSRLKRGGSAPITLDTVVVVGVSLGRKRGGRPDPSLRLSLPDRHLVNN